MDEALRTLQAVQYVAEHGEVCPAGWTPGDPSMKADSEGSKEYFSQVADSAEAPFATTLKAVTTRGELDALIAAGTPLVVDVVAPWCGKCRMLAPHVEQLQKEHAGVTFVKIDQVASKELADGLGVTALPTFKLYTGGREAGTVVGYKKKALSDAVAKLVAE